MRGMNGAQGTRVTGRGRVLMLLIAAGAVSGIVVATTAIGSRGHERRSTASAFTVSAQGTPVARLRKALVQRGGGPTSAAVALLGIREGRAFYRVGDSSQSCYAVGPARSIGDLSATICWDHGLALMDFSVVDVSPETGEVRLFRSEGIAADQVSSVAVTDPDGNVVARVPVVKNIYAIANVPTRPIGSLVAVDASGRTVFSKSLR
jgi:hypothetical protein